MSREPYDVTSVRSLRDVGSDFTSVVKYSDVARSESRDAFRSLWSSASPSSECIGYACSTDDVTAALIRRYRAAASLQFSQPSGVTATRTPNSAADGPRTTSEPTDGPRTTSEPTSLLPIFSNAYIPSFHAWQQSTALLQSPSFLSLPPLRPWSTAAMMIPLLGQTSEGAFGATSAGRLHEGAGVVHNIRTNSFGGAQFMMMRLDEEEPKPAHSYIGLIALAILSSAEKRLVLSEIYRWIIDNYAYFRSRGPGWRNSVRHNLSLNDCFVKCARSANGKGHYWAIHSANMDDFKRGDFRRRRAQRKVRRAMGLSIAGDDDSPCVTPMSSPSITTVASPTTIATPTLITTPTMVTSPTGYSTTQLVNSGKTTILLVPTNSFTGSPMFDTCPHTGGGLDHTVTTGPAAAVAAACKRRLFTVDSILGRD